MGKKGNNRTCPRCGGVLYVDKDIHGWYEQCLQCAYIHDLEAVYEAGKPVPERTGK